MSRLFSRWNADVNAWVVDSLDIRDSDDVLDIGCGSGDGIALAARQAASVTGIDHSDGMVASARKRNRKAMTDGRVKVVAHDVDDGLPLDADSIDKVFGIHVVYFLRRPTRVVRECRRVLRPGGRLMLAFDTHRHTPAFVRRTLEAAGHRLYDEGSAVALLLRAGFKTVEVRNVPNGLHVVTGVCGTRRRKDDGNSDPLWRIDNLAPETQRS